MQIRVFNIPVAHDEEATDELNSFLRANKIISLEKQFYLSGDPCWTVFVTYLPGSPLQNEGTSRNRKVDYKEILPEDVFAKFSKLRVVRKQLAAEDAVPAYAVFTDAELAQIASLQEYTEKALLTIPGIGEARIKKYGLKIIAVLNETGGKTD